MIDSKPYPDDLGFTLIEALVVLAIAAAAMALVPVAIGLGQTSLLVVSELEQRSSERRALAAVSDRLQAAQPIFETRENGLATLTFDGDEDRLRFISEFADGPAGGGLYKVQLEINPTSSRLTLSLQPYVQARDLPPTHIALQIAESLTFRYFGLIQGSSVRAWQRSWTGESRLPELVEVTIAPPSEQRPGPAAIIALRLAQP